MAIITLQNSARTIQLDEVVAYSMTTKETVPVKKIPGRSPPLSIDIDTRTLTPREYNIQAEVTNSVRDSLFNLKNDHEWVTLTDSELTDYVWVLSVDPVHRMGFERPWLVSLRLLSSSN